MCSEGSYFLPLIFLFFHHKHKAKESKVKLRGGLTDHNMSFVHFSCLVNYADLTPGNVRGPVEPVGISFCYSNQKRKKENILDVTAAACNSVGLSNE